MHIKKRLLLLLIIVASLTFFFFQKDYQKNPSYLSGDEPHYIMMTDSFIKDGDFNLRNDYALHRSNTYYPVPNLEPQLSPLADKESAEWYPIHTVGLPILLAIPYDLFGVLGARLLLIIFGFGTVLAFYLILKKYIKSEKQQWIGMGLLLACALFWQNLGSIFPDLMLVTLWGFMILLFDKKGRASNAAMAAILIIAGVVHSKGFVLMAPLMFFNAVLLIRSYGFKDWLKKYWLTLFVLIGGIIASTLFLYVNYGAISPSQLYGKEGSQLFSANPFVNAIAILTDRSKGILLYFPLLIVSGPYIWKATKDLLRITKEVVDKKLKITKEYLLIAGVVSGVMCLLVTVLGFHDWSGSTAPNGRTVIPFIMVTIFLIAMYVDLRNRVELFVLGTIGVLCAWLSWLSIVDFKYYMTTGVNSFWVDRFQPLMHLPLFNLTSNLNDRAASIRGAEVLALVIMLNVALVITYRYRYKLIVKKRT